MGRVAPAAASAPPLARAPEVDIDALERQLRAGASGAGACALRHSAPHFSRSLAGGASAELSERFELDEGESWSAPAGGAATTAAITDDVLDALEAQISEALGADADEAPGEHK